MISGAVSVANRTVDKMKRRGYIDVEIVPPLPDPNESALNSGVATRMSAGGDDPGLTKRDRIVLELSPRYHNVALSNPFDNNI